MHAFFLTLVSSGQCAMEVKQSASDARDYANTTCQHSAPTQRARRILHKNQRYARALAYQRTRAYMRGRSYALLRDYMYASMFMEEKSRYAKMHRGEPKLAPYMTTYAGAYKHVQAVQTQKDALRNSLRRPRRRRQKCGAHSCACTLPLQEQHRKHIYCASAPLHTHTTAHISTSFARIQPFKPPAQATPQRATSPQTRQRSHSSAAGAPPRSAALRRQTGRALPYPRTPTKPCTAPAAPTSRSSRRRTDPACCTARRGRGTRTVAEQRQARAPDGSKPTRIGIEQLIQGTLKKLSQTLLPTFWGASDMAIRQ
eukprot:6185262-Pleurochrysis_carterae.AAC.1